MNNAQEQHARILEHYGIKGMQWGVRRKRDSKTGRVTESSDSKRARKISKKKLSEMSNEELKVLTQRMQLERQYKDLTSKDVSRGRKFVGGILESSAKSIGSQYITKAATSGIDAAVNAAIRKDQ